MSISLELSTTRHTQAHVSMLHPVAIARPTRSSKG
jgi:hypothetical protein